MHLDPDLRQPLHLQLLCVRWRDVTLEPRYGYVGWRCRDDLTGEVLHYAALKEMLRWIAAWVPRQAGLRSLSKQL